MKKLAIGVGLGVVLFLGAYGLAFGDAMECKKLLMKIGMMTETGISLKDYQALVVELKMAAVDSTGLTEGQLEAITVHDEALKFWSSWNNAKWFGGERDTREFDGNKFRTLHERYGLDEFKLKYANGEAGYTYGKEFVWEHERDALLMGMFAYARDKAAR